jgi:DNA-binding NtrC family response regulator
MEDIPELLMHFWSEMKLHNVKITSEALNLLLSFRWPGNTRQLKSFALSQIPHLQQHGGILIPDYVEAWLKKNKALSLARSSTASGSFDSAGGGVSAGGIGSSGPLANMGPLSNSGYGGAESQSPEALKEAQLKQNIIVEVKEALASKKGIDLVSKLEAQQKAYVLAAMEAAQNNRSQAAKILGISRQRLSNWLSDWGIF